jgi:hypothetical protein
MAKKISVTLGQRLVILRILDSNKDASIAIGRTVRSIRGDFSLKNVIKEYEQKAIDKDWVNSTLWDNLLDDTDVAEYSCSGDNLRWLQDRLNKGDASWSSPSALLENAINLADIIADILSKKE